MAVFFAQEAGEDSPFARLIGPPAAGLKAFLGARGLAGAVPRSVSEKAIPGVPRQALLAWGGSMAFSSWRLPKVNFGKLPKSRQIVIWRDLGRAVLARPRSLSTYYSDRLLAQTLGQLL